MLPRRIWVFDLPVSPNTREGARIRPKGRLSEWRKKLRLTWDIRAGEKAAIRPYVRGNVVDVGCGRRKMSPGAIGVDRYGYGERIVEYSRWVSAANYKGSATSLPLRDDTVDTVIASHVLEHIWNTRAALDEWLRVLKNGGHLCLLLPDARWNFGRDPTHVHEWTSFDFKLEWADKFNTVQFDTLGNYWSFDCIIRK